MVPPLASIPSLTAEARAEILDQLFEPCTALHTLSVSLLHEQTFETYSDLIASVGTQMTDLLESSSTSDTEWLDKILAAHPRLGEKKVDSEQSRKEQAQLNTGGAEEAEKLKLLNEKYETAFPVDKGSGLRYVVFVNGRSRPVIMQDMTARIERADINRERSDAIRAMCDIALDRASKLL